MIAWKRFTFSLFALLAATAMAVVICFIFLSERETERVVAFMFPLPHLLFLSAPFRFSIWVFAAVQLLIYASMLGFTKTRYGTTALAVCLIHIVAILSHLAVRGFVP